MDGLENTDDKTLLEAAQILGINATGTQPAAMQSTGFEGIDDATLREAATYPGSPAPVAPKPMPWGEVASQAVSNIPESAGQFASDMAQPFLRPIDTAKTLAGLGRGILEMIIPGSQGWEADEKTAEAVGQFFADRYGSIEGIKRTLAKDPVGMLADISSVLSGGGTLAARAPGMVGKIGNAMKTAGRVSDPLSIAGRGAKLAGKHVIEPIVSNSLGLMTGAGPDSIRGAAKAGYTGGDRAKAFRENMRGHTAPETVVGEARAALSKMRQERGKAYRDGMAGVNADRTVLDFRPIDDALRGVSEVGVYKGKVLNKSTEGVWRKIAETVDEWRMSDPADFHTAEGLDALKKAVGDIRDTTDFNTPSRVIADQVYSAIRKQIVQQAPDYAKVMAGYETASDLLIEVEKSLSLGKRASADTALRKLQSVMRNNGHRLGHTKTLEDVGAPHLTAKLAGLTLSSPTPRGIQGAGAAGVGATMALYGNPQMLPTLALSSPRMVGEAAYYTGKAGGMAGKMGAKNARALGQEAFQVGRIQDDEEMRRLLANASMNGKRNLFKQLGGRPQAPRGRLEGALMRMGR